MTKMGRNDPCYCGSGEKYKKCCLEKDQQMKLEEVILPTETKTQGVINFLSYEEVDAYSTEGIIDTLRGYGIYFDKDVFLNDVETFYSAEDISENWFDKYQVTATGRLEDFPWFAAWILWERMAPTENLSLEQMDVKVQTGYDFWKKDDPVSTCDEWLEVWERLKYRMKPEYKNFDYLDAHYSGTFFISNLVQDLELVLHQAGQINAVYFEKRMTYCREFCQMFPEASELIVHNMRRAIADSYSMLKQYDQAEKEFEQLVVDFPDNPWGYIGWGDMLYMDKKQDYQRAKGMYEKALLLSADDPDIDEDVAEERLADLSTSL